MINSVLKFKNWQDNKTDSTLSERVVSWRHIAQKAFSVPF